MSLLKKILLGLLGLVVVLLIIAAFLPKTFLAEGSIVINRPQQEVFDYVKYVKNQDNYGKWNLMDPAMKKSYEGTDGTVGFKYTWDSKEVGKGTQTILEITEGKEIKTELDFGFGDPAISHMTVEPVSASETRVTWGISGASPWPTNLMGLFYDMSGDFKEGLTNLKNVLEQ